MKRLHNFRSAFSLMELLAVVTILGIIAALVLPRVSTQTLSAKEKCCYHNRAEINIAVEQYYVLEGSWPADNLSDIGADTAYFPQGVPTCPVSGDAYQLDSTSHRVDGHVDSGSHSP